MLMIGVIPLPALMKSSLSGTSSGRMNSPSIPPRPTIVPGSASTRNGETWPESTRFGVMLISPSSR